MGTATNPLLEWLAAPVAAPVDGDPALNLRDVDLRGGQFRRAVLRDADLRRANLAESDLAGADLRGANLQLADLSLCDLREADLRGADLSGADLSGANLGGAQVHGADLTACSLDWAWLQTAQGAPDAWVQMPTAGGRAQGKHRAAGEDEPIEGLRALQRGVSLWKEGQWLPAERALKTALRWVPDSDAARYYLGALALVQGDATQALRWFADAVAAYPRADRARADAALVLARQGDWTRAAEILADAAVAEVGWLQGLREAAQSHDLPAAVAVVRAKAGESPGVRFAEKPDNAAPLRQRPQQQQADDPQWQAEEKAAIASLFMAEAQPPWVWHGAISRALAIGDIGLAQRAEQRLRRVAPDQRLWSLELKQLDTTAQAFDELVRTRWGGLGRLQSLRWVALGAHGPTAKLQCENGTYFAKRYGGLGRPAGSVAFTHRACRFMAERGFAVPVAVPDSGGDDAVVFGEDLLALYPDLQGAALDDGHLTADEAHTLGGQLARIHVAGQEFGGTGRPRGGVRAGSKIVRHRSPRSAWLALNATDSACSAALQRHPHHERILSLLDLTARRLRDVLPRCPVGLVHGDFAGGNVLVRQDGTLGVVDWDLCDVDLPVWDLARCADLLALHWQADDAAPVTIRRELLQAVVAGYEAVRPLGHAERLALPLLVAASRLDLDATVLPLCVRLEPECGDPVWRLQAMRLARAAAGAPEIAEVLGGVWGRPHPARSHAGDQMPHPARSPAAAHDPLPTGRG